MSSQRRTTRSAKANIPDIPLPPRREPAKKTRNEKPSVKPSKTSKTLINSNQATAFLKKNASKSASNVDLYPKSAEVETRSNANPEALKADSDATAVSSNALPVLNPGISTSASSAPSVISTIQKPLPDVPMRPRPTPITSANRPKRQSVDEMFISKRGVRYKQPVHPPPQSPSMKSIEATNSPPVKTALKANKQKTFVNSMGMSIDYEDSSDGGDDLRNSRRRPAARRSPTPGASGAKGLDYDGEDEEVEDEEGEDEKGEDEEGKETLDLQGDESDQENYNPEQGPFGQEANDARNDSEDEEIPEDPVESENSGSDFGETIAELSRKRAEKANRTVRPITPTMSEQDNDDEEAFEEEFGKDAPSSPQRIPASKKGKGRAHDTDHGSESQDEDTPEGDSTHSPLHKDIPQAAADDADEDEDTEPGMTGDYSSGPISNEDKEAAFEAHAEMIEKLENIAQRCNKPLKHFLAMVGQYAKPTRALSPWEVYQPWYSAFVEKKPANLKIQLWTKHTVSVAYNKKLKILHDKLGTTKPSREEIEDHFKEQFDFYRGMIKNYITAKKDSKKFAAVVSKVVEPFVRMSTQVSEELGIHIFGFAIETTPDSCSSVAWGGSHEYKVLRDQHKTVIQTQLHDYEGMFKVAEMQGRANPASKHRFFVDIRKKDKESERDYLRRILGEFLRSDLAGIFSERDKSSDENSHATKAKMTWSWTENAYDKDLRIINWEKDVAFPKTQFDPKKISHDTLKKMVKPRIAWYQRRLEAENHENGSSDDMEIDSDEEFSKLVQIVSWTEEERTRELKDKHSIPLVVDVAGRSVLKVFDSNHYIASMKNVGASIQRSRTSEHSEDDESDSSQRLQQRSGSGPSSRNVATQKQQKQKQKRDKSAFVEVSESEDSAMAAARGVRGRTLGRPKPTSSRMSGVGATLPSTHSRGARSLSCDRNSSAEPASKSQPSPARASVHASIPNSHSDISPSILHHPHARSRSPSARRLRAKSPSQSRSHLSSSKPSASRQQVHIQSQLPSGPPSRPNDRLPSATRCSDRLTTVSPARQRIAGRTPSVQVHDSSVEHIQNPATRSSFPAMASNAAKSRHQQLYSEPRRPMVPLENHNIAEHERRMENSASRPEAPGLQPQQGVQRNSNTQVDSEDERNPKRRRLEIENSPPFPLPNGHHNNTEPPYYPQMRMGSTNYADRRNEYLDDQRHLHFNTEGNDYMNQRTQEHGYPHGQYWDQSNHQRHPVQQPQDYYPPPGPHPDRYPTHSSYTRYNGPEYPQDRNSAPGPSYHQYDNSVYRNHQYYK